MILPDLPELVALRGAAQGLNLRAHRPALARLHGGHRSAQRGRGLEFEEVRLYAPGDDARSIDWRVTARRGKPHTKMFREDRERPVWLLADLHPGLFFGSKRQLKSALLLRAAALLGLGGVARRRPPRRGAVERGGAGQRSSCRRARARPACCRCCRPWWKRSRARPDMPRLRQDSVSASTAAAQPGQAGQPGADPERLQRPR